MIESEAEKAERRAKKLAEALARRASKKTSSAVGKMTRKEALATAGRMGTGGLSRSAAKVSAARKNVSKARQARYGAAWRFAHTGGPMTPAQRQAAYRARLKEAGGHSRQG